MHGVLRHSVTLHIYNKPHIIYIIYLRRDGRTTLVGIGSATCIGCDGKMFRVSAKHVIN